MTRRDVEFAARTIRGKCLRLSWQELVDFWEDILTDLKDAYDAAVEPSLATGEAIPADSGNPLVKEKLSAALAKLGGSRAAGRLEGHSPISD